MIIEPDDKFIEIFAFVHFELGDALASSVIDKNGERVFRLRTRLYVDDKVFDSDDIKHFYTLNPNTDNPVEELKLLLDKLNEAVFDGRGKIDFNIVSNLYYCNSCGYILIDDKNTLAASLIKLLSDYSLRIKMGDIGKQQVRQFSSSKQAEKFIQYIKNLSSRL